MHTHAQADKRTQMSRAAPRARRRANPVPRLARSLVWPGPRSCKRARRCACRSSTSPSSPIGGITSGASTKETAVSDKKIIIPKFAGAGVAFAGVEIQDAFLLFFGVLVGFVAGWLGLGMKGFIGIPLVCYFATTWYLEWKEG